MIHSLRRAALAATILLPLPALAQGAGWFVPKAHEAAPAPAVHHAPHASPRQTRPVPVPVAPLPNGPEPQADNALPPVPLPPVPNLPALPKVAPPPAAVIGVLGVPDVMRASLAAQAVEKVIGERREKLNADAQKELAAERDMGERYAKERGKLNASQQRAREHEMQDRAATAQKQFRQRNQIIQQAAQYALSQIERTLIAVIRQVAESHGMNLVLHRAQVALNTNDFDITKPVTDQLNKLLPSVNVPPDGMTVAQYLAGKKQDTASDAESDNGAKAAPDAASKDGAQADQGGKAKPAPAAKH